MYFQTAYYDFSTTASCGGSPIVLSTAIGCTTSNICESFANSIEYTMTSRICSENPFTFDSTTRNYVVKEVFASSSKCEGNPIQGFAVAADSTCHQNPSFGGNDDVRFLRANCNGNQPIWEECHDSRCTNCTIIRYTNNPCKLTGASASTKISCFVNPANTGNPILEKDKKNNTIISDDPFNDEKKFSNGNNSFKSYSIYVIMFLMTIFCFLCKI